MLRNLAIIAALAASPALALELQIDVQGEAEGTITIELNEEAAPLSAARLAELARAGAYDGVVFHRVIEGFMAQTGDVQYGRSGDSLASAGMGGSDLPDLPAEFSGIPFTRGIVGMARSQDPDSANSQFFIMFDDAPHLNGQYTVVGQVTSGLEVLDAIKRGDPRTGAVDDTPDVMVQVRVVD